MFFHIETLKIWRHSSNNRGVEGEERALQACPHTRQLPQPKRSAIPGSGAGAHDPQRIAQRHPAVCHPNPPCLVHVQPISNVHVLHSQLVQCEQLPKWPQPESEQLTLSLGISSKAPAAAAAALLVTCAFDFAGSSPYGSTFSAEQKDPSQSDI